MPLRSGLMFPPHYKQTNKKLLLELSPTNLTMPTLNLFLKHSQFSHYQNLSLILIQNFFMHFTTTHYQMHSPTPGLPPQSKHTQMVTYSIFTIFATTTTTPSHPLGPTFSHASPSFIYRQSGTSCLLTSKIFPTKSFLHQP